MDGRLTRTERDSFAALRKVHDLKKRHLAFLKTLGDHDLAAEIGFRQSQGRPLTIKQALLMGTGSVASMQRQLRRLRHSGVIRHLRSEGDRRVIELVLTPKALRSFGAYASAIAAAVGQRRARARSK